MTEAEIKRRLSRVYAAFGDKSEFKPEDFEPTVEELEGGGFIISQDFTGGRSQENLYIDAASIINEIMGIRDRAKAWLTGNGRDSKKVDAFVKSELAVALVHDLANTDKHGKLDAPPFSGYMPSLAQVHRATTLKYDPATGTYASSGTFTGPAFDALTGKTLSTGSSSDVETVLASDIQDEYGNKVGELQKVLPDAIYKWEQFLVSNGLVLT